MLIVVGLLLVVALTMATGYFVAQEFGYVAVDRGRLQRAARDGDRRAARALKVTQRLSFVLSGSQLGITVTALLVGYVAEPYLGAGLAELIGAAGVSKAVSLSIAIALALAISTIVQMVVGELAPKNLAIARAESIARALAPTTTAYLFVAGPIIRIFDKQANRLLRRVGVEPVEELEHGATPEDLERIVAEAEAGGLIDRQLSILLDRGLDFRARTAEQAMTTWVDVVTIGSHEPCTRVVELLHTGHSRFPVIDPDASNYVVGIVAVTDLLAIPSEQRVSVLVGAVAKPPLVVPAGKRLRGVLDDLRTQHRQIACVIDEFGLFVGVITLEDIAEELVGPIRDEDDPVDPAPRQLPDGSWLVPARWRIDEIADETGIRLRKPDHYDTLSGLLLAQLGRAPDVDEEVALPIEVPDGSGVRTVLSRVVSVHRRVANEVLLFAPESDVT